MNVWFRTKSLILVGYERFVRIINKIPAFWFILIVISCNFLTDQLHTNEEHYFALAKQFYDSDWMPWSFSFNEWPGSRLLYQYIAGFFLHYLSFEQTAFFGKLLTFILISYPLSLIIKKVRLSNLYFFFLFQLVFVFHQYYFSHEWMIGGFESKTLAYPFILLSFYYVLINKWFKSVLFVAIATYFHLLLGGWFSLIILIYYLVRHRNLKKPIVYALVYVLLILPIFLYILKGTLKIPGEVNGISYDYLIAYFRNPGHAAIFSSLHAFFYIHLPGILLCIASFIVSYVFLSKIANEKLNELNKVVLISFGFIFLFIVVGSVDNTGFILKFLPYRIETVALLFFLMVVFGFIDESLIDKKMKDQLSYIALTFALPLLIYSALSNINITLTYENDSYDDFYEYVITNTEQQDVFAFIGFHNVLTIESDLEISFSRNTRRDLFVLFKFVPYGEKIYEWHDRLNELIGIEKEISNIWSTKEKYKIDYLVSKQSLQEVGLEAVFSETGIYLYKLKK